MEAMVVRVVEVGLGKSRISEKGWIEPLEGLVT